MRGAVRSTKVQPKGPIKAEYEAFVAQLEVPDVQYVPMSALKGENETLKAGEKRRRIHDAVRTAATEQKLREKEMAQEMAAANARRDKELKDKDRELARERERAREIREAKERELAREREQAAKDRQTAEATAKEKKDTAITYNKEAAKQKTADVSGGMPTYKQPKAEQ